MIAPGEKINPNSQVRYKKNEPLSFPPSIKSLHMTDGRLSNGLPQYSNWPNQRRVRELTSNRPSGMWNWIKSRKECQIDSYLGCPQQPASHPPPARVTRLLECCHLNHRNRFLITKQTTPRGGPGLDCARDFMIATTLAFDKQEHELWPVSRPHRWVAFFLLPNSPERINHIPWNSIYPSSVQWHGWLTGWLAVVTWTPPFSDKIYGI